MTRKEFKNRLDKLQEVITRGLSYYAVWKKISLHDAGDVEWSLVQQNLVLDRFKGFFSPVAFALRDMALMEISKVFDQSQDTVSLNVLLAAANKNKSLRPHLSESELRRVSRERRKYEKLLDNLQSLRDKQLAHAVANAPPAVPVPNAAFEELMEWVKEAFNTLSVGYDQNWLSLEFMLRTSDHHTTDVLNMLVKDIEHRQREFDEEMVRIGLDEARRAEVTLGHRLDRVTLGSAIGTLGLTKEQMQRVEREYNSKLTRSVSS